MNPKPNIYNLDLLEISKILAAWGEPGYRARQIWSGLYRNYWQIPEEDFTPLPLTLRRKLSDSFTFGNLRPVTVLNSSDGETQKTLFELPDGNAIECVLMADTSNRGDKKRLTLCISTQIGCAMGCVFCATGQMGFLRNLSSGEIVEQVIHFARSLRDKGKTLTNVVVMGMGEPFHNYNATMEAIDRLNHPDGFAFGARRFTVSTAGIVPAIRRFASEQRQVNLAISLHAANDILRSSLLPINRKYPLDELLETCRKYVEETNRRITFEWALIHDVNDSIEHSRQLAKRLSCFRKNGVILCHVNVIPLNDTKRFDGRASTQKRAKNFQRELRNYGIPCTIRRSRGIDIHAGCGQLAAKARS